jgi:hypothetical protein
MKIASALTDPTNDTAAEAEAVQLECIRRMSPLERLRAGCRMSSRVRRLAFEAIRGRHEDADEMEVRLRFIELAYGANLAADVRLWLRDGGR